MKFGTERRKRWCLVAAGHLVGASGLAALSVMTSVTPAAAANGPTDPTGPLDQHVTRPAADDGPEGAAGGQSDMSAASGKADAFRARLRLDHGAAGHGQDLLGDAGASVRSVPGQPSTDSGEEASGGATEAAGGSSRSAAMTGPQLRAEKVSPSTDGVARVGALIKSFEDRVLAGTFESNRSRLLAAARGDDAAAEDGKASTGTGGFGADDSVVRPDGAMDDDATAPNGKAADGKAEAADGKTEAGAPGDDLRRFLAAVGDDLADGHGSDVGEARDSLLSRLSDAMGNRAADDTGDAARETGSDVRKAPAGAPDQDVVTGEGATTASDDANAPMGEESMTEDQQGGGFSR